MTIIRFTGVREGCVAPVDITFGKAYQVFEDDYGDSYVHDDVGHRNWAPDGEKE